MSRTLNDLKEPAHLFDLFVLSRFFYRIGKPLLDDATYDSVERTLRENNSLVCDSKYLERTYDDDPVPYELLREFSLERFVPKDFGLSKSKYAERLDEDKSLSIQAVNSDEEVWEYMKEHRGKKLVISLKVDGVNSKTLYIENNLEISLSRARHSAQGFDYTKGLSKVIPLKLQTGTREVKVFSENFVSIEGLSKLREKYNPESYKTPKSSAISLLRVEHKISDYAFLRSLAFNCEGLTDSLSGNLEILKANGFDVVPYIIVMSEDVPTTLEEFKPWIGEILYMFALCTRKEIPSDGLVIDVDDLKYEGDIKNQYSSRQISLKYGPWKAGIFRGKVTSIIIEQRRIRGCCKVKIEPEILSDYTEARVVNVFNPSILIKEGINEGTEVIFERNSNTVNILVRGKKLEDILKEN